METSILNEQDDDDIYIVELSRSVHEHHEQSDSEDDENYDVRYENAQDKIQDNRNGHNYSQEHGSGRGRGRGHGRGCDRGRGRGRGQNYETEIHIQLSISSPFNIFQHSRPMHGFILNAPTRNENFLSSPYSIFSMFFSYEQINTIVQNTNKYACLKGAGEGRKWVELIVGEFKIWLAILIYAGIFKFPSIRDYWVTNNKFPEHKITNFMTILRFEQVCFF